MKKTIFAIFLVITVCVTVSFTQTKSGINRKRNTYKKTTISKKFSKKKPRSFKKTKKMQNINNNAVTTESGLTYIITKRGEGTPIKAGDNVIVNYTGMLTNGAKFDSSLDRNEPFSFPVGAGMVIKGWDEGLQKLRVGDHAILTIPPAIGYGSRGAGGVIPPDATLIFIIEVLGVK